MEGLFKLIFYVIIIIFWAAGNSNKLKNLDKDLSGQIKRKPVQFKQPIPPPTIILPEGGDIFKLNTQSRNAPDLSMSYEQFSEMRRKKAKEIKTQKQKKQIEQVEEPVLIHESENEHQESTPVNIKQIKKPTFALKSNIKEGIIWTIILGPPRSREQFDWNSSHVQKLI